jgi:cytoskeletal protein RodZ
VAKKATRRERKGARAKAQRSGRPPSPGSTRPAAARSPTLRADDTDSDAEALRDSAPEAITRSADRAPRSAARPLSKKRGGSPYERVLLIGAALVAVGAVITYLAMNRAPTVPGAADATAETRNTAAPRDPAAPPATVPAPTAPPVDLSPPTIVAPAKAPLGAEPSASAAASPAIAPAAKPTAKAATASATTAAAAKATSTAAPSKPPTTTKPQVAPDPY